MLSGRSRPIISAPRGVDGGMTVAYGLSSSSRSEGSTSSAAQLLRAGSIKLPAEGWERDEDAAAEAYVGLRARNRGSGGKGSRRGGESDWPGMWVDFT